MRAMNSTCEENARTGVRPVNVLYVIVDLTVGGAEDH
ncbi:MAG: hypothetical protein H6Q84_2859, partial [Deltaproteobacteria bacterium]|nr:hypothetical protein [Deltaproteobacteria bacterium]